MPRCVAASLVWTILASVSLAAEPGFTSLFDGKTLDGWLAPDGAYRVEDGAILCVPGGKGNLLSAREYGDFTLRFEFRLTPGANNGLGVRCPKQLEGNLHLLGTEIQILDHDHEKYASIKPYQVHGSVYGIVPAKRVVLRPIGAWNDEEVTCRGRKIRVVVNGQTIVDADLDEATKDGTVDGQSHPGLTRSRGHIGLLGHGDRVDVRNIRIQELTP